MGGKFEAVEVIKFQKSFHLWPLREWLKSMLRQGDGHVEADDTGGDVRLGSGRCRH